MTRLQGIINITWIPAYAGMTLRVAGMTFIEFGNDVELSGVFCTQQHVQPALGRMRVFWLSSAHLHFGDVCVQMKNSPIIKKYLNMKNKKVAMPLGGDICRADEK